MAKPYFTRVAYFTNPAGIYFVKNDRFLKETVFYGAGDEARTRYLHLGKVALYRMSYTRNGLDYYNKDSENVKPFLKYFLNYFYGSVDPSVGASNCPEASG